MIQIEGQPGLHGESQTSQCYRVKSCPLKTKAAKAKHKTWIQKLYDTKTSRVINGLYHEDYSQPPKIVINLCNPWPELDNKPQDAHVYQASLYAFRTGLHMPGHRHTRFRANSVTEELLLGQEQFYTCPTETGSTCTQSPADHNCHHGVCKTWAPGQKRTVILMWI